MKPGSISATEFKAKCLDILDRIQDRSIDHLNITKRGKVVAVLIAPPEETSDVHQLHGFLKGSVLVPEGIDLTAPALDEQLDADIGSLHR